MKKITLLLIFIPLFLITALNFSDGNTGKKHPPYLKSLVCSSCHATIVDGIIINGKTRDDLSSMQVNIELPDYVSFSAVQVDVKGIKTPKNANFPVYEVDDYGIVYNTSLERDLNGKKANILTFDIPIEEFESGKEIEIQGLLTNGDGTDKGDFSFSKKIVLETKNSLQEPKKITVFTNIEQSQITIKGAEENSLVSIINVNGQLAYQNKIASSKEIIDVSNFDNGYYFVQTSFEEKQTTTKLIVAK